MNIESSTINCTKETRSTMKNTMSKNDKSSVNFADELKETSKAEDLKDSAAKDTCNNNKNIVQEDSPVKDKQSDVASDEESDAEQQKITAEENAETYDSCNQEDCNNFDKEDVEENNLGKAIDDLSNIVEKLNQPEEKLNAYMKKKYNSADNDIMINNDFNIQDNKDLMPQMNPNMNFAGNGQPFSSFMNESSEEKKSKDILKSSARDLAEEAAILSTMEDNIAIAKRNYGIKNSDIILCQYDSIIMNQADVEVFANLVANGEVNMNNLAPNAAEKATYVSKTLAEMLAKSMENNQPLRINFDNNISVIIRISRDGKISADFLPSSQVAEAYLKETLPLLKQRFDENNIEYDSLNQRERQDSDKKEQRKKGRNNE